MNVSIQCCIQRVERLQQFAGVTGSNTRQLGCHCPYVVPFHSNLHPLSKVAFNEFSVRPSMSICQICKLKTRIQATKVYRTL